MRVAGAVLEQAVPGTDAVIAENAGATRAELRKQVAYMHRVVRRNFVLVEAVRRGHRLQDCHRAEHAVEPVDERILLGRRAAGAVEYMICRVRHGFGVLSRALPPVLSPAPLLPRRGA